MTYGDLIPYLYTNIFKDKNKLKKRFIDHLKFFYSNWSKYPKNLKLEINYKDLYSKKNIQKKIASFLEINNKDFLHKFPKHKKYIKNKNFVDPSTLLSKQIKLYQKKS